LFTGSAATGLGAGGIAANSGAGQGGLGSVNAADNLAAHGAYDFGTATSGKSVYTFDNGLELLVYIYLLFL